MIGQALRRVERGFGALGLLVIHRGDGGDHVLALAREEILDVDKLAPGRTWPIEAGLERYAQKQAIDDRDRQVERHPSLTHEQQIAVTRRGYTSAINRVGHGGIPF